MRSNMITDKEKQKLIPYSDPHAASLCESSFFLNSMISQEIEMDKKEWWIGGANERFQCTEARNKA